MREEFLNGDKPPLDGLVGLPKEIEHKPELNIRVEDAGLLIPDRDGESPCRFLSWRFSGDLIPDFFPTTFSIQSWVGEYRIHISNFVEQPASRLFLVLAED